MSGLIDQYNRLRKYTIGKMQFPITYIIFGLITAVYMIDKSIFELLTKTSLLSLDLQKSIEIILVFIYSKYLGIVFILVALTVVVMLIVDKTNLPFSTEEKEWVDGTTSMWSLFYVIRRLLKIIFLITTYWWVWCFVIILFFEGENFINAIHPFVKASFESKFYVNMAMLFYVNILVLCYYVIKSLSYGKHKTKKLYIKGTNIKMFICFNEKNEGKVKILKEKYSDSNIYYVVEAKSSSERVDSRIPNSQSLRNYKVILQTENLEEAIYLFDNF